jgi:hypothetical protein
MLIREVLHCKPGKVRPLVDKFKAMNKLQEKAGLGKMRLMTDFSGAPYWTMVAEFEVPSMKAFEDMMAGVGQDPSSEKEFETIMKGYHDLIENGRREVYKIEE